MYGSIPYSKKKPPFAQKSYQDGQSEEFNFQEKGRKTKLQMVVDANGSQEEMDVPQTEATMQEEDEDSSDSENDLEGLSDSDYVEEEEHDQEHDPVILGHFSLESLTADNVIQVWEEFNKIFG